MSMTFHLNPLIRISLGCSLISLTEVESGSPFSSEINSVYAVMPVVICSGSPAESTPKESPAS